MEPHGQARGPQQTYPPTPLGAEALRCASAKASVGHPPVCEIRRSIWMHCQSDSTRSYAFLHGQGRGLLRRRMKHSARLGLPGSKEFGAGRHNSKIMIQGIEGGPMLRVGVRGSTV